MPLDLTPFGFTPTEGVVYKVLLRDGPGTGYAIARAAGLARANAYSALEGLTGKGAARVEAGRPKRYRPEPPAALLARIASDHGQALSRLTTELEALAAPPTPTLVEITSSRGALQLIQHDVARAATSVELLAPAEAFPAARPGPAPAGARGPGRAALLGRTRRSRVRAGDRVAGTRTLARCAARVCGRYTCRPSGHAAGR